MANYNLREVLKQLGRNILSWVKSNCVNNCVSTTANLPLAAAQGKALQDQITTLNSNISKTGSLYSFSLISGSKIAGSQITEKKTIPAGCYLITAQLPNEKCYITITNKELPGGALNVSSNTTGISRLFKFESETTICAYANSTFTFNTDNRYHWLNLVFIK